MSLKGFRSNKIRCNIFRTEVGKPFKTTQRILTQFFCHFGMLAFWKNIKDVSASRIKRGWYVCMYVLEDFNIAQMNGRDRSNKPRLQYLCKLSFWYVSEKYQRRLCFGNKAWVVCMYLLEDVNIAQISGRYCSNNHVAVFV
jgi:hypothetical protein